MMKPLRADLLRSCVLRAKWMQRWHCISVTYTSEEKVCNRWRQNKNYESLMDLFNLWWIYLSMEEMRLRCLLSSARDGGMWRMQGRTMTHLGRGEKRTEVSLVERKCFVGVWEDSQDKWRSVYIKVTKKTIKTTWLYHNHSWFHTRVGFSSLNLDQ